jgi:hypothetical protein
MPGFFLFNAATGLAELVSIGPSAPAGSAEHRRERRHRISNHHGDDLRANPSAHAVQARAARASMKSSMYILCAAAPFKITSPPYLIPVSSPPWGLWDFHDYGSDLSVIADKRKIRKSNSNHRAAIQKERIASPRLLS